MGDPRSRSFDRGRRGLVLLAAGLLALGLMPMSAVAQDGDPREGLGAGFLDAETAASGMERVGSFEKPDGPFFDPVSVLPLGQALPAAIFLANSDLAFKGDLAFHGNFSGFQIMDVSDPTDPQLLTHVLCPGGQGDMSVHGDLLFMSVEETRGRIDCGTEPPTSEERFRGVRIFDISDINDPVQVAAVQTCRGSHTHRVVEDLSDPSTVYVYVNGTAGVRPDSELAGCNPDGPETDNPSRWRIEVIEVPLDTPQDAAIVNEPRLFADPDSGAVDGLQNEPPTPNHPSGEPWFPTPETDACHDITVFPERGLAAGACEGNGLLIDISDPANPVRIDAVSDPNFAYWHSANFNNDGTTVMFTDEWGGGTQAKCRPTDAHEWGANGFYTIEDGPDGPRLEFASYFKMPAAQTTLENCVAHQANLVPVPGRDVMAQAWYQGGISVFDFGDPSNVEELAFFDQGPLHPDGLALGGYWSGYWHNGQIYGAEIARGLDVFDLTPTDQLTANEIAAANTVVYEDNNPMAQRIITWDPSMPLARAYLDQLAREGAVDARTHARVDGFLERAQRFIEGPGDNRATHQMLDQATRLLDPDDHAIVLEVIEDVRATLD